MKHPSYTILIAALLAGCSNGMSIGLGIGGGGRHFGLGTSVNIPIGGQTRPAENLPDGAEQQPIAYFSADGQISDSAVKGGFERRLLAKQDNEYLVQDFYSGGGKRTDPMRLTRDNLLTFNAHPHNGSHTVYDPSGQLLLQKAYRDGRTIVPQP